MLENIIKVTGNYKSIVKSVIICLISTVVLAIASQISIPLPGGVPMTLQTFSVALIGYSLSKKYGIGTIFTYLACGVVGIPVFAGGNFGISTIFGLTGGFLIGFILLVWFCNKAKQSKNIVNTILLSGIGLISCHTLGVLQYSILTGMNLIQAFSLVSLPFLLKDSLSIILALLISDKVKSIKGKEIK